MRNFGSNAKYDTERLESIQTISVSPHNRSKSVRSVQSTSEYAAKEEPAIVRAVSTTGSSCTGPIVPNVRADIQKLETVQYERHQRREDRVPTTPSNAYYFTMFHTRELLDDNDEIVNTKPANLPKPISRPLAPISRPRAPTGAPVITPPASPSTVSTPSLASSLTSSPTMSTSSLTSFEPSSPVIAPFYEEDGRFKFRFFFDKSRIAEAGDYEEEWDDLASVASCSMWEMPMNMGVVA